MSLERRKTCVLLTVLTALDVIILHIGFYVLQISSLQLFTNSEDGIVAVSSEII